MAQTAWATEKKQMDHPDITVIVPNQTLDGPNNPFVYNRGTVLLLHRHGV